MGEAKRREELNLPIQGDGYKSRKRVPNYIKRWENRKMMEQLRKEAGGEIK